MRLPLVCVASLGTSLAFAPPRSPRLKHHFTRSVIACSSSSPSALPRIAILDSFTIDGGDTEMWAGLRDQFEVALVRPRPSAPGNLDADDLEGCVAALTKSVVFDAAALEAAAAGGLRYLGVAATGTNTVDLEAAARLGVAVTNVPGFSSGGVAQMVMAYLLHDASAVHEMDASTSAGGWEAAPDFCYFPTSAPLQELEGTTLALVGGGGAIARRVAACAEAFGIDVVLAIAPGRPEKFAVDGEVPLEEALAQADVVSLHCPLTPTTEGMADAGFFAAMRPHAVLINTARGALVDEAAAAKALDAGELRRIYTDVVSSEPPLPGSDAAALCRHPHVVATPHVAFATSGSRRRLVDTAVANAVAWARGDGAPSNRVA